VPEPKSVAEVIAVHAPQPEQTVNIDLCVVPISHEATAELISASLAAAAREPFSPARDASER
jgi:hypothetical protein